MGVRGDRMRVSCPCHLSSVTSQSPLLSTSENPGRLKVESEGRDRKTEKNNDIIT